MFHLARRLSPRTNLQNSGEEDLHRSFYFRAENNLPPELAITQSERSRHLKRPSPYTIANETGSVSTSAFSVLLRNIFVSVKMEFFCRINNKPRMHCQLCWIVASMVFLDSKNIADAIVCACTSGVIAEYV